MTLTANRKLFGQGVALTSADVGTATGRHAVRRRRQPGPHRVSDSDVMTLATNTEIAGVSINPDGAANGITGNATPGVTLRSMEINDTGTAATQPGSS